MSLSEMIILAVLALVLIGPKQLPDLARSVGRLLNEFKRASGDFTNVFIDVEQKAQKMVSLAEDRINRIDEGIKKSEPQQLPQVAEEKIESQS